MKFRQFFIFSLCTFILSVCYTSDAQTTVSGAGVIYEGPAVVNESDQFSLTCFGNQFVVFKWRRNGGNIDFGNADNDDLHSPEEGRNETSAFSKLTIKSALSEHSGNYKCSSESEDYGHNLTVICATDFKLKAEFSHGQPCTVTTKGDKCRLGTFYEAFSMRCVKDGGEPLNNSLTANWYHSKDEQLVEGTKDGRVKVSDGLLEITNLWPQDVGFYLCKITNKKSSSEKQDLAPIKQDVFEIQALPVATPIMKDMTVVEGNQINVSCSVTGEATRIVWKFDEKDLFNGTDGRVTMVTFREVPEATLLVSHANSTTDRGTYKCTAISGLGNSSAVGSTFVRIKSKYAALGPFLGICAEVIILCTIILIYEKKRDKTELEESDTDQGPETKSSPDHGQDSVRYRK